MTGCLVVGCSRNTVNISQNNVTGTDSDLACDADENSAENAGDMKNDSQVDRDYTVDIDLHKTSDISSGVAVHDPSILKADGHYYIYGSHMSAAKSDDLFSWESIADGYIASNPVFGQIYDVADESFAYSGSMDSLIRTDNLGTHVWAPHVIYNEALEKYFMYYCTSSTWNASNLCYGISDSPEGPFEWQGALIYSGFNKDTIEATDVLDYVDRDYALMHYVYLGEYNSEDYPNAIDPTVFYDKEGRMWMVYGSWSGGIFLLEIDPETGKVIHPEMDLKNNVDAYFGKRLLGGGHNSIEGPYVLYDENSDYYYLFVSYGGLVSDGGYQVRVFRSKEVDGDYVDMNDQYPYKNAIHKNFGLKLTGNYILPSVDKAYMAPGHNSAFFDEDGKMYLVYHTRFDDGKDIHSPRVHQMLFNEDGWPCVLPYQTRGEVVDSSGYDMDDVCGRYYIVDLGIEIDDEIMTPQIAYLEEDGKVYLENGEGNWEMDDGSYYVNLTLGDITYKGVVCKMKDEAGENVMTLSVVGDNHSIWGVRY